MYRIKVCLAVFVFTWKDWARLAQLSFKFPAEGSLPVIFSSMLFANLPFLSVTSRVDFLIGSIT